MTAQVTTSEDSVGAICGAHRHSRFWQHVLEWALILWVVRVPLATTALGLLILGVTPQAQDLFVELARARYEQILLFLFLLFFIWALPTHYSARLLLDTDERFQRLADQQNSLGRGVCLRWMERWTPRGLGLLTFAAVLIAIWRSYANLPLLDQREVNSAIGFDLLLLAGLVLATAIAFVVYTIIRPRDACTPGLRQLKNFASLLTPIWRVISPGLPNTPELGGGGGAQSRPTAARAHIRSVPRHSGIRRRLGGLAVSPRTGGSAHSGGVAPIPVLSFRRRPAMARTPVTRTIRAHRRSDGVPRRQSFGSADQRRPNGRHRSGDPAAVPRSSFNLMDAGKRMSQYRSELSSPGDRRRVRGREPGRLLQRQRDRLFPAGCVGTRARSE